ncbi:EcsC family protein [Clostridium polynesiense]|uniref:EcsC family protein n=1 Tax=Clostridium polynesiense TaxID=1325933 RepID=UPI00058D1066|nr:EcsC family protein [Clostridium polynesiense]
MDNYEKTALRELKYWQKNMQRKPSIGSKMSKGMQDKINHIIPEQAHKIITEAIKNMVKMVAVGSEYTTRKPILQGSLRQREELLNKRIDFYKKAGAVSGAGTGAGGILLGLADFPILLSMKIKFLFESASIYGFDVKDYRERLYILYIFQIAFSSQERRNEIYNIIKDWDNYILTLPENSEAFDWRVFQQEYRDYIDLAKLMQLVPGIGAVVGAYANYKLLNQLGYYASNAYRMRVFKKIEL